MGKRVRVSGALVILLFFVTATVSAGELENLQRDYNNSRSQARIKAGELSRSRNVANSISEKVNYAQQEYEKALSECENINREVDSAESVIREADAKIEQTRAKLDERTKILGKRVRDIFENGQVSYLDVLLGARNFEDLINRLELVKRILTNDAKLIASVNQERAEIARQREEKVRELAHLKELQQESEKNRAAIAGHKREVDEVMEVAANDLYYREQAYEEEMAASRNIEQMIRNIERGGSSNQISSTGSMIWPAGGPITSPFGWRVHPIFGTSIFHSGIDIGADYGDTISAADSGTVIYADWMSGYGKTIIIQHANGLSTLYGHCSTILVASGQRVRQGQAIGRVGSTGNSTGPHLHFEVRLNGSPVNPGNYLG